MKRLYSLFALMMAALTAYAAPVDQETALGEARAFLLRNVKAKSGLKLAPAAARQLGTAVEADGYYVFNVGREQGFIVVSADDRTPAVLGYTDQGTFDPATAPASVRAFLAAYSDQIAALGEAKPQTPAPLRAPRLVNVKRSILPLLSTLWNQDAPYNLLCPIFLKEEYGNCVTGCVGTAMAQIMKYYEWPKATKAAIPAYQCTANWEGYGHISVPEVPAGTTFDWANMLPAYIIDYDVEEAAAVAQLMAAASASVATQFSHDQQGGSSAPNNLVPVALEKYFDYAGSAAYVQRANYLFDEWNDMIYKELQAGRPVMMGGQSSGGGHAFVVDGYLADNYFHINWGWGGYCNGYFLLDVCNSGSSAGIGASNTRDGYSYHQDAVIGIQPNKGTALDDGLCRMLTRLDGINDTDDKDEVVASFYSQVDGSNVFNFGLGLLQTDGTYQPLSGHQTTQQPLERGMGYASAVFPVKDLPEGTHKIMAIGKLATDSEWRTSQNPGMTYVEAVVKGGKTTLRLVKPEVSFEVLAVSPQEQPVAGKPVAVDVTVKNAGDDLQDYLFLYSNENGNNAPYAQLGVILPARRTTTVTIYYTPTAAGTFQYYVGTSSADLKGPFQMTVAESLAEGTMKVKNFAINGVEEALPFNMVYGLLSGKVTLTNPSASDFDGKIIFYDIAFDGVDDNGNLVNGRHDYYSKDVFIPAGQDVVVDFDFDGTYIDTYHWVMLLDADGETIYQNQNDIVELKGGAIFFTTNGAMEGRKAEGLLQVPEGVAAVELICAEDLTDVQGGNPNTLFFPVLTEVPQSLAGRNLVYGDKASSLTLTDGFPFYTPYAFTAAEVTYKRTFTPALDLKAGKGWETIVLPFSATSIDAGGRSCRIGEFSDESGSLAIFTEATGLDAAVPYIIGFTADAGTAPVEVTFSGKDALVRSDFLACLTGDNLVMQGLLDGSDVAGALTLSADGSAFVKADGKVAPFRACFRPASSATETYSRVAISAILTGVQALPSEASGADTPWYGIDGRRIQQPAHRGIYIRGGRKVVVK